MKCIRALLTGIVILPLLVWPAVLQAQAIDYSFLPAIPASTLGQAPLTSIARCDDRLLAVGERGLVIWSDDSGEQWQQAPVPVSQALTAVFCLPGGQAWATGHGGVILMSADRGASWELVFDGNAANQQWLAFTERRYQLLEAELDSLDADGVDADRAADLEYALEDAGYAVEDAQAAIEVGPADPLLDIYFMDAAHGIAVGAYGMLYLSSDGGASWQLAAGNIENPDRYHYYAVTSARSGNLILSGEAGLLFRSRDGGKNWDTLDSGYDGSLFGLLALSDGGILAFGLRGNVLRSDDDGDSWATLDVRDSSGLSLYSGVQLDSGLVVLVGSAGAVVRGTGTTFTASLLAPRRSTMSSLTRLAGEFMMAAGMDGVLLLQGGQQ